MENLHRKAAIVITGHREITGDLFLTVGDHKVLIHQGNVTAQVIPLDKGVARPPAGGQPEAQVHS